ncbi:10811_t:CDS:2 [Entrophospora sp. SA101]|nr:10811_t:CDS:2 [Entrophospora sp. SA101]
MLFTLSPDSILLTRAKIGENCRVPEEKVQEISYQELKYLDH